MASHQEHLPVEERDKLLPTVQPADYSTLDPSLYKRDRHEIEMIEADLKSCSYSCYKCWVIFVMICACIAFVFSIVALFTGMGLVYIATILSAGWNAFQLNMERKAMRDYDLELAEKALLAFKYYIVAIPILYLIFGIVEGLTIWGIILSVILNALLFYLLIFYGGQKVAEKLRRRQALINGPTV